jgi:Ca-activated chloride channel homolog
MFIIEMKAVMENQDKLYQQFKDAAGKAESKGFDRMEAVWNRVEEKLDGKEKPKVFPIRQYVSIAAILLLCLTVGGYIITNDTNSVVAPKAMPENNVSTVIDTQKVEEVLNAEKGAVQEVVIVTTPLYFAPGGDHVETYIEKLDTLAKGRNITRQIQEEGYTELDEVVIDVQMPPVKERYVGAAIAPDDSIIDPLKADGEGMAMLHNKDMKTIGSGTIEQSPRASFVQNLDGQFPGVKVQSVKPAGTSIRIGRSGQSIVEPLYVIDGMIASYEIFKQLDAKKIESITLLKDEGARAIYSDRGKNGVIIITTKDLSRKEKRQLKKLIKEHAEKSKILPFEPNKEKP